MGGRSHKRGASRTQVAPNEDCEVKDGEKGCYLNQRLPLELLNSAADVMSRGRVSCRLKETANPPEPARQKCGASGGGEGARLDQSLS